MIINMMWLKPKISTNYNIRQLKQTAIIPEESYEYFLPFTLVNGLKKQLITWGFNPIKNN